MGGKRVNTATDDIVIKCEHRNPPAVMILGTIVDFVIKQKEPKKG